MSELSLLFAAVLVICYTIVAWRLLRFSELLSGAGVRSLERRELQLLSLLERLTEKMSVQPPPLNPQVTDLHARERNAAMLSEESMELEALRHRPSANTRPEPAAQVDEITRSLYGGPPE